MGKRSAVLIIAFAFNFNAFVFSGELEDYIAKNHLYLPSAAQEIVEKYDLVPAIGMPLEDIRASTPITVAFVIQYLKREDAEIFFETKDIRGMDVVATAVFMLQKKTVAFRWFDENGKVCTVRLSPM